MTKDADSDEGLIFPAYVKGKGSYGARDYEVSFKADYNEDSGLYDITELGVVAVKGAKPLNGSVLRSVRVQEAFGELMFETDFELVGGGKYRIPRPTKVDVIGSETIYVGELVPPIPANRKDAQKVIRLHARRIFRIASAFGQPELRLIQGVLGVSQSTASRLVRPQGNGNGSEIDDEK